MKKNFFDRMSESYEKFHLEESELNVGNEKMYVNPKLKLALGWSLFLLCCVVVYFLVGDKLFGGKQEKTTETPVKVDFGDLEKKNKEKSDKAELIAEEIQTSVEQETVEKLNAFISGYYEAITSCDNVALQRMVVDPKPFRSDESLKRKAAFITGYHDITVYVKEGPDPETYVTFVVANLTIEGVNSSPYDIMTLYIVNGSEGYRVNNGNLSDDVIRYIQKVQSEEDIQKIYQSVERKNMELQESDETLKIFYDTIHTSNAQDEAPSEEDGADAGQDSQNDKGETDQDSDAASDSEADAQQDEGDGEETSPVEEELDNQTE